MESLVLLGSFELLGCLLLALSLVLLFYSIQRRAEDRTKFMIAHDCQTGGPSYPGIPFLFGLDFIFENMYNVVNHKFTQGVARRFDRHGTTHRSDVLLKGVINTIDPENLEAIFKTRFEDYTIIKQRAKLVTAFFGDGIFSNSGSDWRESRSLVHMAMASITLDQAVFEKHASRLIESIRSNQTGTFDFAKVAHAYTLDVATGVFFGESTGSLVNQEEDKRLRQFALDFTMLGKMARVLTIFNSRFPVLKYLLYPHHYKSAKERVSSFADDCVERALASQRASKQQDLKLPKLQRTVVEGLASQTPDGQQVRKEALNLLLAARDTVGIGLSETMYWLAQKPAVWAKLRSEVGMTLQGRAASLAELKKLAYLKNVLNEALRLQPTLSVHGRIAIRDTILPRGGGPKGRSTLFVSKGSYVVYSLYALHKNPQVFGADVDKFRPERWEDISPSKYEYLDFGTGPRQCPGKQMGWVMVAYAIVRLAQEFKEVESRDARAWEEARAFSFFNRHGVLVGMVPE